MEADYYRIAQSLFSRANYEWRRYVRHVLPKLIPAADLAEMEDDACRNVFVPVPRPAC